MSYLTQNDIASSQAMISRVAQAFASEHVPDQDPDLWTFNHRRTWASAPGWDAAWESALVSHPEPEYDPGEDEGVITDAQILAQVQSMLPAPAAAATDGSSPGN